MQEHRPFVRSRRFRRLRLFWTTALQDSFFCSLRRFGRRAGGRAYRDFLAGAALKSAQRHRRSAADLCWPSRNKTRKSVIVRWMTDRDDHAARLRDRATRLLAVALQARDDGNDQYAEELTLLASEAIEQATDLENHVAQVAWAAPHVAQQTQKPQSAHGCTKSENKGGRGVN